MAHLARDLEDLTQGWPGAILADRDGAGAARLIRAPHTVRDVGLPEISRHIQDPLISVPPRRAGRAVRSFPHPRAEEHHRSGPGRDLLEFSCNHEADVTRFCFDSRVWAHQHQRAGPAADRPRSGCLAAGRSDGLAVRSLAAVSPR